MCHLPFSLVGMILYYLKDSGTVIMTANAFGLPIPTVTSTVRIVFAIKEHLSSQYICLPTDAPSLERLIAGWEQHTGFPMVLGAVDGTHTPIMQPYINSEPFFADEIYNQRARCL